MKELNFHHAPRPVQQISSAITAFEEVLAAPFTSHLTSLSLAAPQRDPKVLEWLIKGSKLKHLHLWFTMAKEWTTILETIAPGLDSLSLKCDHAFTPDISGVLEKATKLTTLALRLHSFAKFMFLNSAPSLRYLTLENGVPNVKTGEFFNFLENNLISRPFPHPLQLQIIARYRQYELVTLNAHSIFKIAEAKGLQIKLIHESVSPVLF